MWQRESLRSGEGRKKQRLIQLLHESPAARPDSGLLSNWSKNKGFFEPRSNWLHDCMFDFQCNFKIMAASEGDANSEFFAAPTSSLEDFIHKSLKDEQTECIRRIVCLKKRCFSRTSNGIWQECHILVDSKSQDEKLASFWWFQNICCCSESPGVHTKTTSRKC